MDLNKNIYVMLKLVLNGKINLGKLIC